jgi:glycosyltransferase involved in cell wall biosynthesis
MHRSGTSLAARILSVLGVELGKELMPARADNEEGFWEHREITETTVEINRVLNRRAMSPTGILPYPDGWWDSESVRPYVERLREVVAREIASADRPWGFKDPHSVRLLPMWQRIFADLRIHPRYVLAFRNPAAVAASLIRRDGISRTRAEFLWLLHNVDAFRYTDCRFDAIIRYERWFDDALDQAKSLIHALKLPNAMGDAELSAALQGAIRPTLCHHRGNSAEIQSSDAKRFHELLVRASNGDEISDEVEKFLARFSANQAAFAAWVEALDEASRAVPKAPRQNGNLREQPRAKAQIGRAPDGGMVTSAEELTFPGLPVSGRSSGADRVLNICIVTPDIVGPIRNGGIGTAYKYVADTLSAAGHKVTILYSLGTYSENGPIEKWVDEYARKGIRFIPMPTPDVPAETGVLSRTASMAYGVYEWLKRRTFDLVHVSEWRGTGYYCLLAKHLGLAFQDTVFCVKCSSPLLWNKQGNHELFNDYSELIVSYMERRSVELADVVVSGSLHLLRWMAAHGYRLPAGRCFVQPNIMPPVDLRDELDGPSVHGSRNADVREVAFFGRLEMRKGLHVFCNAIGRLSRKGIHPQKVTFLGKRSKKMDSADYIARQAADWSCSWEIIDGLSQPEAIAYLRSPGRLAVIPSLLENSSFAVYECLAYGIPFIASNTGGTPELVAEADQGRVLFEPHPAKLAAKLEQVLTEGARSARARFDFAENTRIWLNWHADLAERRRRRERPAAKEAIRVAPGVHRPDAAPLVSVCLTHYNRPRLLQQAISSLKAQNYPNFEVILVDDGSTDPDAIAALDALEAEFASRGWRIVRQENLYLGAARNTAARHARGKYLLFMDDDNCAKPHEISTFVAVAERTDADILTCFSDTFAGENPPDESSEPPTRITPVGDNLSLGLFRNGFGDANALVRREVYQALGGYTEHYGVGKDDHEFFARAVLGGYSLYVVPEALYWYRKSEVRVRDRHFSDSAGGLRVLEPYIRHLAPHYRDILLFARGTVERLERRGRALGNLPSSWTADDQFMRAARLLVQSRSWRYTRPLRNLARRIRNVQGKEIAPDDVTYENAAKILVQVTQSTSWSLTGPLRVLTRLVRRVGV